MYCWCNCSIFHSCGYPRFIWLLLISMNSSMSTRLRCLPFKLQRELGSSILFYSNSKSLYILFCLLSAYFPLYLDEVLDTLLPISTILFPSNCLPFPLHMHTYTLLLSFFLYPYIYISTQFCLSFRFFNTPSLNFILFFPLFYPPSIFLFLIHVSTAPADITKCNRHLAEIGAAKYGNFQGVSFLFVLFCCCRMKS